MGTAGPEDGAEGGQCSVFSRDGAGRPAGVAGRAPGRRRAAAVSALLGGPTCHVPTRPLPPAQSGLTVALAACTSVYVSTLGPTRSWSEERRFSGCRWATGRRRCLWTASSRTRGQSQCSRQRRRSEVGRQGRPPHPPLPPSDGSAEGGPVETL